MEPTPVQPLEYAKVQPSNRAAVASLIFGLLLFIPFVAGIVAIVLGRKGKQVARERNGHGSQTAKAGYILGIVNIALSFLATTIAVSLIIEARQEGTAEALRVESPSDRNGIDDV